jgi:hypothetical protein
MKTVRLNSSAIECVSYDESTHRMIVDFVGSGSSYDYCGVPKEIFNGLISAQSAGRFYNEYIKDKYQC